MPHGMAAAPAAHPHGRERAALEKPTVRWGAATLFLVGWAIVSLTNAAETLFLKRVGVEQLPLVFLVNSALLAASTYLAGRWIARVEQGRALTKTLWLAAATLLPLWIALELRVPGVLALLVIAAKQIQAIALLAFWVAMGGWVDGRQAKRLVPPMMAGGTIGAAVGSFASSWVGARAGIPALVGVAASALVLAALATRALRQRTVARIEWRARSRRDPDEPRPTVAGLWRESGLFRLLAAAALLAGLLAPVLYYEFSAAADLATRGLNGEQDLLRLYGTFRGWMNVAIVALQLGGTSWLFRRVGVPRAALLAPTVYAAGFLGLASIGALWVAIAAMAAATLQDKALGEPAERTLATLFPERTRPTVAALLDGMLKRGGGVLGNALVLAMLAASSTLMLPRVAAVLALAWLACGIALARVYPALLLEAATRKRFGRGEALLDQDLLDERTIRLLEASLIDPDPVRCAVACDLVVESPAGVATAVTAGALRDAPARNVPVLLSTVTRLVEGGSPGRSGADAARRALLEAVIARTDLAAEDRARMTLLAAAIGPPGDEDARETLTALADDPAGPPSLRLAARVALSGDEAGDLLAAAVGDGDEASHRIALEALRTSLSTPTAAVQPNGSWHAQLELLATLLADPAHRREAASALAQIAARYGAAADVVTPRFLVHQDDPDPQVRAALLRFLGHVGRTDCARWAIARLASRDAVEVAAAQSALRSLGAAGIDLILEAFHCDCRSTREALLPVLRDIPVDTATLRSLVDAELAGIRRVLDLERSLAGATTSGLVRQRLAERIHEGTRAALSLFAALFHDERIAELGPLLERVREGRERAVLLEALEALLPSGQAGRLLSLLESRLRGRDPEPPERRSADREEALRRALADEDSLTRAFVAATLEPAELDRLGGVPEIAPDEPAHPLTPIRPIRAAGDPAPDDEEVSRMLSGIEIVLHLRSLALFERLSTRELTELAGIVREITHPAGTCIVREGDFDDCMYLIVSGSVRITRTGVELGQLGPKEFFGEMAILDGETRSATVTSITRVRLLRLDRPDLLRVMDDRPGIAISICQTLSRRVRELNDALRDLRAAPAASASA